MLVFNRLGRGVRVNTQFALLGQDCRINPLVVPRYQDGMQGEWCAWLWL